LRGRGGTTCLPCGMQYAFRRNRRSEGRPQRRPFSQRFRRTPAPCTPGGNAEELSRFRDDRLPDPLEERGDGGNWFRKGRISIYCPRSAVSPTLSGHSIPSSTRAAPKGASTTGREDVPSSTPIAFEYWRCAIIGSRFPACKGQFRQPEASRHPPGGNRRRRPAPCYIRSRLASYLKSACNACEPRLPPVAWRGRLCRMRDLDARRRIFARRRAARLDDSQDQMTAQTMRFAKAERRTP